MNESVNPAAEFFSFHTVLSYLSPSSLFLPRSILLAPPPSVTRSYCISFRPSSLHPTKLHPRLSHPLRAALSLSTRPPASSFLRPSSFVPAFLLYFRPFTISPRYARADGPMGFREAFATVSSSILRLLQDTPSRACTLTSPPHTLPFCSTFMHSPHPGHPGNGIKVRNGRSTDIFGFSIPPCFPRPRVTPT